MTAKVVVHVSSRVRHLWAARLGAWFLGLATVEIFADGKSLGRRRIVDVEWIEDDEAESP